MRVGLVIVTFNAAGYIGRSLTAVAAQTRRPDRIIVVDNASSDATLEIVRAAAVGDYSIELLPLDSNRGFAVANNLAVERLDDCDLIALLNPDAFPETGWLAALISAAASHPEAASFASRLMVDGAPDLLDGAGDAFHVSGLGWRVGHRQPLQEVDAARRPRPVFAACGAAALYRRADWVGVGGFDERFFCYAEDLDLGFRLQLLGRECRYVPDAVAEHVGSATTGEDSDFSVYHGYRNLEWTFVKNMPAILLWRYLPLHVVTVIAQLVWFGRRGRLGSVLRAKRDALIGLPAVLRQRRHVQKRRQLSAARCRERLDRTPLRVRFGLVRRLSQ